MRPKLNLKDKSQMSTPNEYTDNFKSNSTCIFLSVRTKSKNHFALGNSVHGPNGIAAFFIILLYCVYFESIANNAVALIVHIHRWKVKCRPINLTLKANFFHAKFISPKQREFSIHSADSPTYILEKIMNASSKSKVI